MKEIGGYFEFEQLVNNEYHKDLIALNSARNCLRFIIKKRGIKRIYLPYLICDVIISACNDIDVKYYHIGEDFLPILNSDLLQNNEYLYVINFYGLISNKKLSGLKREYKRIIVDNTHSFFQKPLKDVDTIYNCRKYFGVPDGAYLSTTIHNDDNIPNGFSQNRFKHLIGRYENTASEYYSAFKSADESFDNEEVLLMSKLTKNLMGAIDYKKAKKRRVDNYNYLQKELGKYNMLSLQKNQSTFMYPLYINGSEKLRNILIKNKVYIPVLWPNVLEDNSKDSLEYKYSNEILPLPIDQRYSTSDMRFIVDIIKKEKGDL